MAFRVGDRLRLDLDPPLPILRCQGGAVIYRFAGCELDTTRFELRRGGTAQKIEPQVFELLRYLVERQGQFVGKDELHKAIWRGRVVSDAAMSSRIKAARRAVGDNGTDQRVIHTVHGRGFSFVAPVVLAEEGAATAEAAERRAPAPEAAADANALPIEVLLSADVHLSEILRGDGPVSNAESDLLSERAALQSEIEKIGGRVLSGAGGGVTAHFRDAGEALECAAQLQASRRRGDNDSQHDASRCLRIGISECTDDAEQTAAVVARLQCWAAPGDICVTGKTAERGRAGFQFAKQGVDASVAHDLQALGVFSAEMGAEVPIAHRTGIPQLRGGYSAPSMEPSIVLLPFDALGDDVETAELAEGLRIDIQNGLVKTARILLIAAASANAFRGKDPAVAAASLGVRYVLHGVVQMAGKRARVSMELIDSACARAIWTEQFDVTVTDPFLVQDEITRKVIAVLDVKLLSGEQARIWHQALADPQAVKMFYRGVRLFFRMERERMAEARRAFEAVAEMRPDSSIGATWAALSHWVDFTRRWGESGSESKRLAKQWAERAATLPDADGQAHTVLAHVRLLDREFDAALEAGREALAIRPGCANANGFFGNVLHYCGEQDGALAHLRKGIRLQPVYPPFFACILAAAYVVSGRPECALSVGKEALRLNARDVPSRLVLVAACESAGNHALARTFASEILRLEPGFSAGKYRANLPYRSDKTVAPLLAGWLAADLPA